MSKYLNFITVCMIVIVAISSCSEENNREPVSSDSNIPEQVSDVQWEAFPGAIRLTYNLPSGRSLSYVKAETYINGVLRQAKASSFVNHMTIEGFADDSEYTVHLYSVNRSEKASQPVVVTVKPELPNFQEVFRNIELVEDWDGASVIFQNPNAADLAITIIHVENDGLWSEGETFYTSRREGIFSLRGIGAVETRFGVFLRDRWNNATDTLVKDLLPRYERQLDHTRYSLYNLPGTATWERSHVSLSPEAAWDGDFSKFNDLNPLHISVDDGVWPQQFTMHLGVEHTILSRMRIWQRGAQFAYNDRNIRKFQIWGSMEPNPDGSTDDSWFLLLEDEIVKPSGWPLGSNSDEDELTRLEGHEFSFPMDMPQVKFLRFVCVETWARQRSYFMMQIAFWGQPEYVD